MMHLRATASQRTQIPMSLLASPFLQKVRDTAFLHYVTTIVKLNTDNIISSSAVFVVLRSVLRPTRYEMDA
jgi:hypothetical protein